jgi:hypothetical protein
MDDFTGELAGFFTKKKKKKDSKDVNKMLLLPSLLP